MSSTIELGLRIACLSLLLILGGAFLLHLIARYRVAVRRLEAMADPDNALYDLIRSRVIVTSKTGASFEGVLYSSDRTALVLREASALSPDSSLPIDGEVVVLLADIAYLQRP